MMSFEDYKAAAREEVLENSAGWRGTWRGV